MFQFRKTGLTAILTVCLFLGGCLREDLDGCRETAREIVFFYPGNGTTDIFPSSIDHVDMFVFDSEGIQVEHLVYSRNQLDIFQGARPDLPDGDYTIVCWGNAGTYSEFKGTDGTLANSRLYNADYLAGDTITEFDPMYYGRKLITVDNSVSGVDTVVFAGAHINMEIHIAGYTELNDLNIGEPGFIRLDPIPVGYDFGMNVTEERSAIFPQWKVEPSNNTISSYFNLLRFGGGTDTVLTILHADGTLLFTLELADFLSEFDINVEGVNEITVPVYILFEGPNVTVSVTPWDTSVVNPVP